MTQEYFSKTYHYERQVAGYRLYNHESSEAIYLLRAHRCNDFQDECGSLVKLSGDGIIAWEREISWIDLGNDNILEIDDEEIIVSGHRNSAAQDRAYYWMRFTLQGDSISSHQIQFPDNTSGINYGMCKRQNGELIIFGATEDDKNNIYGAWARQYPDGSISELYQEDLGIQDWSMWDMVEDAQGRVLFMARERYLDSWPYMERRNIFQLHDDNSMELLYEGPLREEDFPILWDMAINDDGILVMTYPNTGEIYGDNEFLVAYDQDFNVLWEFTPETVFGYPFRDLIEIKVARNGDFIVTGRMQYADEEYTEIRRAGYIARFSPTGGLLWERGYRDRDWESEKDKELSLRDIVELDDGSLLATGSIRNDYDGVGLRDLWLIRVDADGCLYPDQGCEEIEFTTGTSEWKEESAKFKVVPNPNSGTFQIKHTAILDQDSRVRVVDIAGRVLYDEILDSDMIHLDLSDGLYFLSVYDAEGIRYMERLVVSQ